MNKYVLLPADTYIVVNKSIITEEEYLELNGDKLLHDGYSHRLASRYGKNDVSNFLRSFVICKHCGKTMSTGIVGGGRNSFRFRCNTKGCPMRNKGPAGSLLRDYAVEFLKAHNFGTEENYKRYIEDRNRSIADRTEMLEHSKMSLEQRLAKQKQMYENLLPSLNVSKHVTEERLDSIKSTEEVIKEQLDSVKAEIEALKSAPIKLKEFLELYKNTGEILRLTTSMALADEIIKIFFSNITVEVTKESLNAKQKQWSVVDHTLREPFDKLDDNGDNNTWLGRQGSNLRMTGPKPVALPLGDIPSVCMCIIPNTNTARNKCIIVIDKIYPQYEISQKFRTEHSHYDNHRQTAGRKSYSSQHLGE